MGGGLGGGVWLPVLEATVRDTSSREGGDLPSLGFEATSSSSESATRLLLVRPVYHSPQRCMPLRTLVESCTFG